MLPCPISVYRQEGKLQPIANKVETAVLAIIREAQMEALSGPLKKVAMRRLRREWLTKDVPIH